MEGNRAVGKLLSRPVTQVADNRMADRGKLHADLMVPPALQHHLECRLSFQQAQSPVAQIGELSLGFSCHS
jgi:hypothetical protein